MKDKRTIKGRIAALRLAAAITVAALGVSSCGNDEGEPTVGKEDVAVRLYMTNSDGVESETFRYGEEMVFNLTVDNNSEKAFTIAGLGDDVLPELMDSTYRGNLPELFTVYSSTGEFVGTAWDGLSLGVRILVNAGQHLSFSIGWQSMDVGRDDPYCLFYKEKVRQPLPEGKYYALFRLYELDGRQNDYRVDFEVSNP